MTAASHIDRARRSLTSASVLLNEGDVDGACNRAYYAMFHAAKAALMAAGFETEAAAAKTHAGIIGQFGQLLVKRGLVPLTLGRNFNRVEEIRNIADYSDHGIDEKGAAEAVAMAQDFVEATATLLAQPPQCPESAGDQAATPIASNAGPGSGK